MLYRNDEAPLLEVFDQRDGILLEVGQAAVDGFGVIVGSPLLLGPFLQPLLQAVVGAGQEHHQVWGADLPGERGRVRHYTATVDPVLPPNHPGAGDESVSELDT